MFDLSNKGNLITKIEPILKKYFDTKGKLVDIDNYPGSNRNTHFLCKTDQDELIGIKHSNKPEGTRHEFLASEIAACLQIDNYSKAIQSIELPVVAEFQGKAINLIRWRPSAPNLSDRFNPVPVEDKALYLNQLGQWSAMGLLVSLCNVNTGNVTWSQTDGFALVDFEYLFKTSADYDFTVYLLLLEQHFGQAHLGPTHAPPFNDGYTKVCQNIKELQKQIDDLYEKHCAGCSLRDNPNHRLLTVSELEQLLDEMLLYKP
jgi:hypothetical protein